MINEETDKNANGKLEDPQSKAKSEPEPSEYLLYLV